MELQDYRRPKDDNGLGIHLFPHPYVTGDGLDPWLAKMQAMRLKWTTTLNEDAASIYKLAQYGIQPVVRPFLRCTEEWGDKGLVAEYLNNAGLGAYVQPYNEPELNDEWPGSAPNRLEWVYKWCFAAGNILHHGGLPGIQCLDLDWLRELLRYCRDSGQLFLLEKAWLSVHNYTTNHPPNYIADYNGWLKPLWFQRVVEEELGRQMPVICTEGGWCIGDDMDNRFPKIDAALHAKYTAEGFDMFRTGVMPNGEKLPGWWFAVTPWLIASVAVGGDSAFEANSWYSAWFGERTQTIEAVKALPAFVRQLGDTEEEETMPEFHFGFKDLHDAHPEAIGEATSEQIDIPDVMSLQFTEKGLLIYRDGAGVKFLAQSLPKA